jgi:hypothetical protein
MDEKCIVKGCRNHFSAGRFIGVLCSPCHAMLTEGRYLPGQQEAWFAAEGKRARHADVVSAVTQFRAAWQALPDIPGYIKPTFDVWLARQLNLPGETESLTAQVD